MCPSKKMCDIDCLYICCIFFNICCIFFQGSVILFEYELKTQVDPTEKKQRLVKQTSRTHQKDLELMVNYIVMFIFIVIYCIFTQSAAVLASCYPSCTDSCNHLGTLRQWRNRMEQLWATLSKQLSPRSEK